MGIIGTAVKLAGAYFVVNAGLKAYEKHENKKHPQDQFRQQPSQCPHSLSSYPRSASPHFDADGKAIAHQHASYCNGQCQGQCTSTIRSISQHNPHDHQQEQWLEERSSRRNHYAHGAGEDQKQMQLSQVAENLNDGGYRTPPAYEHSGMVQGNEKGMQVSAVAL